SRDGLLCAGAALSNRHSAADQTRQSLRSKQGVRRSVGTLLLRRIWYVRNLSTNWLVHSSSTEQCGAQWPVDQHTRPRSDRPPLFGNTTPVRYLQRNLQ